MRVAGPWLISFQSTRPHGARPGIGRLAGVLHRFQSTRPHGARLDLNLDGLLTFDVSIHAPAWGATEEASVVPKVAAMFQSTRPHGARQVPAVALQPGDPVSIHAPAWGATKRRTPALAARPGFNPRARMGRDASYSGSRCSAWFQSTRPHGARRRWRKGYWRAPRRFNPRARMGRDLLAAATVPDDLVVSIHAPAWGATR